MDNSTSARLNILQMVGIGVGVVGSLLGLIGVFTDATRFFEIYLVSYTLWLDVTLGCLGFFLLLHLVDGKWGFLTQRIFAAGARVMPLMVLLFIPILVRLSALYPWVGEHESHGPGYDAYHSLPFFIIRLLSYFIIWTAAAYYLSNKSYDSDTHPEGQDYPSRQRFAAGFMVLFVVTVTFASFDLTMSITEAWFSTIMGWLAIGRQSVLAMALAVLVAIFMAKDTGMKRLFTGQVQRDLATLMLATMLVWIYLTLMQYFIMWSGNQPSKIKWFVPRTTGAWEGVVVLLSVVHAAAILLLLTPGLKRFRVFVVVMAIGLFLIRFVDVYWLIMPSYTAGVGVSPWDIALPIGLGGLWVAVFAYMYKAQPLVPETHPHLIELREHGHNTPEYLEGAEAI